MGTYDGSPKSRSTAPSVMYFLVGIGLFALGYFVHGTVSPKFGARAGYNSVDTEKMLASIKGDLVGLYERTQCMPIMVMTREHPPLKIGRVHTWLVCLSVYLLMELLLVRERNLRA